MDENAHRETVEVAANVSPLREALQAAAKYGRQFSRTLSDAFQDVIVHGNDLESTVRSVVLSLSQMTLKSAFKPFETMLGNAFDNLLSGGQPGNPARSIGGLPHGGLTVPFAAGGVITSPVAFPLRGGSLGVAGERGPEAILPLARGPDGRLGVKTGSSSGAVTVHFNVTTPDAEGFRRTEGQLAAMLARVAGRSQRDL